MSNSNEDYIYIRTNEDLIRLINRIEKGPRFAETFKFVNEDKFIVLLEYLKIDNKEYKERYFFYDEERKLHISDSQFGYTWISTIGLVAKGKATSNNFVNACLNQYTVISLLFDKAIEISSKDDVYNIDGFYFGYLSELTPAIFNNVLFYIEVFFKAYLSLSEVNVPHTHEISKLFTLVKDTMFKKKHNNTLFHLHIVTRFEDIVNHVLSIPGSFKEQFVKYDDNEEDSTIIVFEHISLMATRDTVTISNDFIYGYYHDNDDAIYLTPGLLDELINKAQSDEERKDILDKYGFMLNNN